VLRSIEAVLLDMDGTLVDSDAAIARSWTQWASRIEPERRVSVDEILGVTSFDAVLRIFPDYPPDEVPSAAREAMAMQYEDNHDVSATSGAHELLDLLVTRGLPWAIVTSADEPLARARLAAAAIVAPVLITEDDVSAGKPHPEGYLLAAARLGVDPRTCLVVEDSVAGLEAGRAAGCTTAGLRGNAADINVDDLGQLTVLLRAHLHAAAPT
jgi:HAD superfamily hydrolase (TIGR01509 family)